MKKALLILSSLGVLVTLVFVLISCGGSDPKPSKAKVSFASSSKTVQESAGTVEVKVLLDKTVTTDLVVSYSLSGTATQKAGIITGDYSITGDAGEVTIPKGETSASIEISIVNDDIFEQDETIDITLSDVTGNEAQISDTNNEIDITIQSDDPGSVVSLTSTTTLTTDETNRAVQVQVQLDNASPEDITITYTLSGSAVDSVKANAQQINADYAIQGGGTPGELIIPAGETTGSIRIKMYSDFELEDGDTTTLAFDPENIKITLSAASGNGALINSNKSIFNINVNQENGRAILLEWNYDPKVDKDTVDMDLFLWLGDLGSNKSTFGIATGSANAGYDGPEFVFTPNAIQNASFGVTYNYYEGNVEPMQFTSTFIDFTNLQFESVSNREVFTGTYTKINRNPWYTSGLNTLIIEQTFNITDGVYDTPSAISTPSSKSRVATNTSMNVQKFRTWKSIPRSLVRR